MLRSVVLAFILSAAAPAWAAGSATLGITAGVIETAPEVSYRFSRQIGVRAEASFLSFDTMLSAGDARYDGRTKIQSLSGMFDLYPFGGGLRVSGGARSYDRLADISANPSQAALTGGMTFPQQPADTRQTKLHDRNVAPQLTLGYGARSRKGLMFGLDAGILVQGRGRAATGPAILPASLDAQTAGLQQDARAYRVYPIAQLSFGYRF